MWPRWTPQPVPVVVLTLVAAAAAAAASARLLAPPSAAAAAVAQARADQPSKGTPKWQLRAAIFFSQPVRIRDGANQKKHKSRGAQQPSRQHHRCQGWMDFWRLEADEAWQRLYSFRWPLGVLGLFVLLVWFQTWELPAAWLQLISPETWRVQEGVAPPRISLDVFQTRIYASLSTGYFFAFLLVLLTVRDRARLDKLAMALVVAGVVQAVIGVMLFSAGAHYQIYFFEVIHDRVKGTFGYHNHFAGYMELCLSVGVGLM